jgi:hypothetical protein
VPGLAPGRYSACAFDTRAGLAAGRFEAVHDGGDRLAFTLPGVGGDVALAIRRMDQG